ncbi:MAG: pyridoxal phosphate-dependent aminotransferase [Kangiellaceae bacterium]|nr:pyridoxal phosphate-dependent aminotransferase [Kangiellaceae bacterium]
MSDSTLAPYLRSQEYSATLLINQASKLREQNNLPIYHFGFGQSPFAVPQAIVNSLAAHAHEKQYMAVEGDLKLRESICHLHKTLENKQWHKEDIIVGSGSKILLFCIMAAFNELTVVAPAPSWVSYKPQAKLTGHAYDQIVTCSDEGWKLTAKALEQYCSERKERHPLMLIFNSPNNPTGHTYNKQELTLLATVLRKYNVIVIADEIYSLLNFNGKNDSLENYFPEGCIVTSGLSKWCGAGGWRLGFAHIPKALGSKLKASIIGVASETYSCAPSPIQYAAQFAYQNKESARIFIQRQIEILNIIGKYCAERLSESGVKVCNPQGAFYLFPDFSKFKLALSRIGIVNSQQLTTNILNETGVALLPGSSFGMPESSLTARLAFVDFDGKQLEIDSKITEQSELEFDRIKEGIQGLCGWLESLSN